MEWNTGHVKKWIITFLIDEIKVSILKPILAIRCAGNASLRRYYRLADGHTLLQRCVRAFKKQSTWAKVWAVPAKVQVAWTKIWTAWYEQCTVGWNWIKSTHLKKNPAECGSKASNMEQANRWAMQVKSSRTLHFHFIVFLPKVQWICKIDQLLKAEQ